MVLARARVDLSNIISDRTENLDVESDMLFEASISSQESLHLDQEEEEKAAVLSGEILEEYKMCFQGKEDPLLV